MSRYRINVNAITTAQFNPPVGCQPEEVIASWWHAQQIVTEERNQVTAKIACEKLRNVLFNEGLSDSEAIDRVTRVMKRFGLIS